MSDEEMVPVSLGDDYYEGPCYSTGHGDYLIPRSRLERWEAAQTAYDEMQSDIQRVMDEQRERIREINTSRPKTQLSGLVEKIYQPMMELALRQQPLPRPKVREEDE